MRTIQTSNGFHTFFDNNYSVKFNSENNTAYLMEEIGGDEYIVSESELENASAILWAESEIDKIAGEDYFPKPFIN